MNCENIFRSDRRRTLEWLAFATTTLGVSACVSKRQPGTTLLTGYGRDPNLLHPSVPWSLTLSADDLKLLAALSDLLLPPEKTFPFPSEIGVHNFIDEWISAPYDTQVADRKVILSGLSRISENARRRYATSFSELSESRRHEIFGATVAKSSGTASPFFVRLRYLVVGGYFTSNEGLRAIGYRGNVPRQEFPPISDQMQAVLEARLQQLGI